MKSIVFERAPNPEPGPSPAASGVTVSAGPGAAGSVAVDFSPKDEVAIS
jgi:hypothetical protein